jgi:heat shock protein HtpX
MLLRTDFMAASRANQRATRRLVGVLLSIAILLGYFIGWTAQTAAGYIPADVQTLFYFSHWGVIAALALLLISSLWTYIAFRNGDRIVMKMTGAELTTPEAYPQLHNVVEEMSLAAGVVKPKVYIVDTDALNAFATGMSPRKAALGITRGLLEKLDRSELQAVVAHEMGHIVNWDIRYATAVSVLVGLIVLLSDGILRGTFYGGKGIGASRGGGNRVHPGAGILFFLLLLIFAMLAPLIARLVQMAVSRQREFLADASSVKMTRNPLAMISALEKLSTNEVGFEGANRATQHLFIVNPLRHFSEKASSLMATHPPISRRIARLRNLGSSD